MDSTTPRPPRLEDGAGTTYEAPGRARGERLAALQPLPAALGILRLHLLRVTRDTNFAQDDKG